MFIRAPNSTDLYCSVKYSTVLYRGASQVPSVHEPAMVLSLGVLQAAPLGCQSRDLFIAHFEGERLIAVFEAGLGALVNVQLLVPKLAHRIWEYGLQKPLELRGGRMFLSCFHHQARMVRVPGSRPHSGIYTLIDSSGRTGPKWNCGIPVPLSISGTENGFCTVPHDFIHSPNKSLTENGLE